MRRNYLRVIDKCEPIKLVTNLNTINIIIGQVIEK